MLVKRGLSVICGLLLGLCANAQFYSAGDDPGALKWYSIRSPHFNIIYPAGTDSLALEYGKNLEKWNAPTGQSIGYTPNGMFRRPMNVILHSHVADANGMVMWAPRRMELYTGPDGLEPESLDWMDNLTIHEGRHVSQMQFTKRFRIFSILTGELFAGAGSVLYPGLALMEGDAVATETALTPTGRGRSSDFLEYYRACFDEGRFRDWYQWRWGSQKYYTPDYYRAGYMLVSGMRYVFDDPLFMDRYYNNIFSRKLPLPLLNLQYTVKQASGLNLRDSWSTIVTSQWDLWREDEEARGPYPESRQITPYGRRFEEYLSPVAAGDGVFAVRKGITHTPQLVRIDSLDKVSAVRPFSPTASDLRFSEPLGALVWSETCPDPRWTLAGTSRIMTLTPGSRNIRTLTREGRLYNPAPSPSDKRIAAAEYPFAGGSATVVVDGEDGATLQRLIAPDSLQVVQPAWIGEEIIVSAISRSGFGLYNASRGYKTVLAPQPPKIKDLSSRGDTLYFVSDRLGVNELYSLHDGTVMQLSRNRRGASEFLLQKDSVLFATLSSDGRMLRRSAMSEGEEVDYSERYLHPVAEKLSAQEAALGPGEATEATFSAPERYRKALHLVKIHSWVPAYVDYDSIASMSFDDLFSAAGLGASAFFQNDLGTSYGYVSYSAKKTAEDAYSTASWRHSVHANLTYTGLYPVIELSADLGERNAKQYHLQSIVYSQSKSLSLTRSGLSSPYLSGTAKIYVPLKYRRGGWYSGLIPQVNFGFSNDFLNTTEVLRKYINIAGNGSGMLAPFSGVVEGKNIPLTRATASIRGYTMLGTASSGIYPRWGVGAEAGYSFRPLAGNLFTPNAYTYLYGYVPGLLDTHGVRLTVTGQFRQDGTLGESYLKCVPRGLSATNGVQDYIQTRYPVQGKFTLDYAMPVLPVDWSGLGPLAYVRNFEVTLHADECLYSGSSYLENGHLFSAGADIAVRLSGLVWIPFDTRIGVSYNYNGGASWDDMTKKGVSLERHHFGLIFSVDI